MADMDEIERRLDDARACLAKASNTYDMSAIFSAITDIYAAVRLLAARPAPAGGAGDVDAAWDKWANANIPHCDIAKARQTLWIFRAGWDAARAADAARGEKPDV